MTTYLNNQLLEKGKREPKVIIGLNNKDHMIRMIIALLKIT